MTGMPMLIPKTLCYSKICLASGTRRRHYPISRRMLGVGD